MYTKDLNLAEKIFAIQVYYVSDHSVVKVLEKWRQRYPDQEQPSAGTIRLIVSQFEQYGTVDLTGKRSVFWADGSTLQAPVSTNVRRGQFKATGYHGIDLSNYRGPLEPPVRSNIPKNQPEASDSTAVSKKSGTLSCSHLTNAPRGPNGQFEATNRTESTGELRKRSRSRRRRKRPNGAIVADQNSAHEASYRVRI